MLRFVLVLLFAILSADIFDVAFIAKTLQLQPSNIEKKSAMNLAPPAPQSGLLRSPRIATSGYGKLSPSNNPSRSDAEILCGYLRWKIEKWIQDIIIPSKSFAEFWLMSQSVPSKVDWYQISLIRLFDRMYQVDPDLMTTIAADEDQAERLKKLFGSCFIFELPLNVSQIMHIAKSAPVTQLDHDLRLPTMLSFNASDLWKFNETAAEAVTRIFGKPPKSNQPNQFSTWEARTWLRDIVMLEPMRFIVEIIREYLEEEKLSNSTDHLNELRLMMVVWFVLIPDLAKVEPQIISQYTESTGSRVSAAEIWRTKFVPKVNKSLEWYQSQPFVLRSGISAIALMGIMHLIDRYLLFRNAGKINTNQSNEEIQQKDEELIMKHKIIQVLCATAGALIIAVVMLLARLYFCQRCYSKQNGYRRAACDDDDEDDDENTPDRIEKQKPSTTNINDGSLYKSSIATRALSGNTSSTGFGASSIIIGKNKSRSIGGGHLGAQSSAAGGDRRFTDGGGGGGKGKRNKNR